MARRRKKSKEFLDTFFEMVHFDPLRGKGDVILRAETPDGLLMAHRLKPKDVKRIVHALDGIKKAILSAQAEAMKPMKPRRVRS